MNLFHHIIVFFISEKEKAEFLEAGVVFKNVTRGPRGECAEFDIGEEDSRWKSVAALLASLEANQQVEKEFRVQDLRMTVPWEENMRQIKERIAANAESRPEPKWLVGYSGQSVDELLALEGKYRIDSLTLAFEQAISQKAEREGVQTLNNDEERIVLAIEALEREVNNGGYDQFFVNSSRKLAPTVVDALRRIGCAKTANITQKAIKAIGVSALTEEAIGVAMGRNDEERFAQLSRCDDSYHKCGEPIEDRLFAFIKANKANIRF